MFLFDDSNSKICENCGQCKKNRCFKPEFLTCRVCHTKMHKEGVNRRARENQVYNVVLPGGKQINFRLV